MLSSITGKTIPQEARPATTSLDVILKIRKLRLRWLGHILRAGPDRLVYKAIVQQKSLAQEGNLLMDTPPHLSVHELAEIASDRVSWRHLVHSL